MATLTIITSVLNAHPLLKHTADSIFHQSSKDWQWIIVDGVSGDGTGEWINQVALTYPNIVFICEPDNGIYDAWNKALPLIKGDWVIFLGAGDKLKSPTTLKQLADLLPLVPPDQNIAYGSVELIDNPQDESGSVSDQHWRGVGGPWSHCRPMLPNHQGIFHRASLFSHGRHFDASYRIAGDTALLLPELLKNGGHYLEIPVSMMLKGGMSQNLRNKILMMREIMRANRNSGLVLTRIHYQYTAFLVHFASAIVKLALQKLRSLTSAR
jgi:glycosyltransferase involved in cell wall biosynthesis